MKYLSANEYFKKEFGKKMYKVSISLNTTCPNRDGTCGTGGCIFCSAGGSGEFSADADKLVAEQIDEGITLLSNKVKGDVGYIAYFQSFTNTYCSPDYLREKLFQAMSHPAVEAISVATRPDCLPDEIVEVLREVSERIPLYIELGLQTSNNQTAELINRCYETKIYTEAVNKLKKTKANIITHVILGLPGETITDMENTVKFVSASGVSGIKFTTLYVLKGTKLYDMWEKGEFETLEMEEYFDIVDRLIELLPGHMVVHRLTGDGPKKYLVAPMWTANKRAVVNYINRRFG